MKRNIGILIVLIALGIGTFAVSYWRTHRYDAVAEITPVQSGMRTAYFAGGCFWCTEADFEKLVGVESVVSGYQGGHTERPTYTEVVTETTGHREAVEVRYDPTRVSYSMLVEYFFAYIDPTDAGGAFVDRGESYTSAIFYMTADERVIIEAEVRRLTEAGAYAKPIVTSILPWTTFWPAEAYHQDYHAKNSVRYGYYRDRSGRNQKLAELCAYRGAMGVPCVQ